MNAVHGAVQWLSRRSPATFVAQEAPTGPSVAIEGPFALKVVWPGRNSARFGAPERHSSALKCTNGVVTL